MDCEPRVLLPRRLVFQVNSVHYYCLVLDVHQDSPPPAAVVYALVSAH